MPDQINCANWCHFYSTRAKMDQIHTLEKQQKLEVNNLTLIVMVCFAAELEQKQ